jgi:hypothetical protein
VDVNSIRVILLFFWNQFYKLELKKHNPKTSQVGFNYEVKGYV